MSQVFFFIKNVLLLLLSQFLTRVCNYFKALAVVLEAAGAFTIAANVGVHFSV